MKLGPQLWDVPGYFARAPLGETARIGSSGRRPIGVLAGLCLAFLAGCGYRPVYGAPGPRYDVTVRSYSTASFEAVEPTVAGVRAELGAAAALGTGFPQLVVEVLRVDERSIGVRSMGNEPLARGSEIRVVGRAQVIEHAGAPPSLDTGDVTRGSTYATGATPAADAAARSRAVRDAARKLGRALGRSVLGLPEPADG